MQPAYNKAAGITTRACPLQVCTKELKCNPMQPLYNKAVGIITRASPLQIRTKELKYNQAVQFGH